MNRFGRAIVALVVIAGAVASSTAASAAEVQPKLASASASEVAAFRANIATSGLAATEIAKFKALDAKTQAQVVAVLDSSDPWSQPGVTQVGQTTTTRTPSAGGGSRLLAGGATIDAASIAATTYDVTATYRVNSSYAGILLGYWKQTFKYQTGSGRVLQLYSCRGLWTGFSGTWVISSSDNSYISGSNGGGYCITTYLGSMFYKGSSINGNKEQGLVVDGVGIVDKWLINL